MNSSSSSTMIMMIQSFPFHYEMSHHVIDVVAHAQKKYKRILPLFWVLPLKAAHEHWDVLNCYAMLARNKDVELSFLDFSALGLEELIRALVLIVLTDDDYAVFDKLNALPILHSKTFVLDHLEKTRYPAEVLRTLQVHCWDSQPLDFHGVHPNVIPNWAITASDLISSKVKFLENTYYYDREIRIAMVGSMNGEEQDLRRLFQRISRGTPRFSVVHINRKKQYPPLCANWENANNLPEPQMFALVRKCTHLLRTRSFKPSGSLALGLSMLLLPIRPQCLLLQEGLTGVGYDEASNDPIVLEPPSQEMIHQVSQDREYHMQRLRDFYRLEDFIEPITPWASSPNLFPVHLPLTPIPGSEFLEIRKKQGEHFPPPPSPPPAFEQSSPTAPSSVPVVPRDESKGTPPFPKIPKLMHSMWLSPNPQMNHIPLKYRAAIRLKMEHGPQFTHVKWCNDSMLEFMGEYFPQHIQTLKKCTRTILKCDISRFMVAKLGGIYSDLDFFVLIPEKIITLDDELVLFSEIRNHVQEGRPQLFNGLFATIPDHPFVLGWVEKMMSKKDLLCRDPPLQGLEVITVSGPLGLQAYYDQYTDGPKPTLKDGTQVMPFTNKMTLATGIDNEKPVLAFTRWHDGSNWGGGVENACVDEISIDDQTRFIDANGKSYTQQEYTNSKKLFSEESEKLVVGVLTTLALLGLIVLLVYVFSK